MCFLALCLPVFFRFKGSWPNTAAPFHVSAVTWVLAHRHLRRGTLGGSRGAEGGCLRRACWEALGAWLTHSVSMVTSKQEVPVPLRDTACKLCSRSEGVLGSSGRSRPVCGETAQPPPGGLQPGPGAAFLCVLPGQVCRNRRVSPPAIHLPQVSLTRAAFSRKPVRIAWPTASDPRGFLLESIYPGPSAPGP